LAHYNPNSGRTIVVTRAAATGDKIGAEEPLADKFGAGMEAGTSPARETRVRHRHLLRTLTYVIVEHANGGIVRDINHEGIGMQVVGAVRPQQELRLRFELPHSKVRVEARGEVTWATRSGQCGVRFLDLAPGTARQINEWIFGNLLEEVSRHNERESSLFVRAQLPTSARAWLPEAGEEGEAAQDSIAAAKQDGLIVSPAPVPVIELPLFRRPRKSLYAEEDSKTTDLSAWSGLDWIFQPLSGRGLIWTINGLVVVAALLLFALVFLTITGEPPQRPVTTAAAAGFLVAGLYWGFFRALGGTTPGVRLARMAGYDLAEPEASETRFR